MFPSHDRGGELFVNQGANDGVIFALASSDVSNTITTLAGSETYFQIQKRNGANGGARLMAFRDNDGFPFQIEGYHGVNDPTDGNAAVLIKGAKSDGGTGIADLAAAERVLTIQNNATDLVTIVGNGNASFLANISCSTLAVGSNITGSGTGNYLRHLAINVTPSASSELLEIGGSGS